MEPPEEAARPPNLVIVSIDTLRADHLGLYGYHRETSPHLDELAERSVVFDQAVTVHVSTAPAHATVLTGLYPGSHGLTRARPPTNPVARTRPSSSRSQADSPGLTG